MGTVLLRFLVGGLAGILAWVICEPFAPKAFNAPNWGSWEGGFVLVIGSLVGLALGALNGYQRGGAFHTARGAGLGLVLGAIGAKLGYGIGGAIVQALFGPLVFGQIGAGQLPVQILARIVALTPLGLFLGAAIGASSVNVKRTVQGAIGGVLGAAAGAAVFDIVAYAIGPTVAQLQGQQVAEVAGPSRAVFTLATGSMIGLFIGLVDRLSRSAWLRLQLGRNEGKEWSIDSALTYIGRSESAQVPLFGDPNVAPVHASIQHQGGQYVLADGGSPAGTYVNGQRIQSALLFHGAQIQIGSFILVFLMKNQAAPVRGPESYPGQAYSLAPQVPGGYAAPTPQTAAAMPFPQQLAPTQAMPASNQTIAYSQAPAQAAGVSIVAIDGPLTGQRFPIRGPMELGRESSAVPLSFDGNASRRHAVLSPAGTGVTIQDLGSTNGTFVNGNRVQSAQAGVGDLVKVGSTTFRIESS